jgi:hypothetical protein
MIINFRAREINRGTRKLTWTSTLIKKTENDSKLAENMDEQPAGKRGSKPPDHRPREKKAKTTCI